MPYFKKPRRYITCGLNITLNEQKQKKTAVTKLYTLSFLWIKREWLNVKFFYVCWRLSMSFLDNKENCNCADRWNWYDYTCNASTVYTRFLISITATSTTGRAAIASGFVIRGGCARWRRRGWPWASCVTIRFSTIVSQVPNWI